MEEDVPTCTKRGCSHPALFNKALGRHIRECYDHQRKRLESDSARRRKKIEKKLCMACSEPRDGQSIYCVTHRESHASRMKFRRSENRQSGVCVECGEAVVQTSRGLTSTRCQAHVDQQREYNARVDAMSPDQRRHFAKYCGVCGVFRVSDTTRRFCTVCDQSRLQCVEYRWHQQLEALAREDSLWPPSSSTFSENRALGTLQCQNERLIFCDVVFLLQDRLVVMECDEFCHAHVPPECEMARMDSLQFGTPALLPTIVARFNPHQHEQRLRWTDFEQRIGAMWQIVKNLLTCRASQLPSLERVRVLYFGYPADNNHVVAAKANPRFEVEVFS